MNKFFSYNSYYILKTNGIHDIKAITSNMQFNTYAYNSFRNCILGNTNLQFGIPLDIIIFIIFIDFRAAYEFGH